MASVDMLPPTMKKEPDVLARTSLLPKRKPIVSSIATRARFVKPRPNVSAIKASKEVSPPSSESVKNDGAASEPVETEANILQRPAIPKRAVAVPVPSRARFQKAKPNIGSLLNKSAKDVQSTEQKSLSTSKDTKTQESSNLEFDSSDASTITSTAEEKCNNDSNSSPVTRTPQKSQDDTNSSNAGHESTKLLLNMEKVVDMAYSASESLPIIDVDSVCGNSQEFFNIRTIPEDKTLESLSEKNNNSDVSMREPASEISPWHSEMTLTSPRTTFPVTPEKENPTVSVMNKSAEYPTLKSILNSPRKRTTTKKVKCF